MYVPIAILSVAISCWFATPAHAWRTVIESTQIGEDNVAKDVAVDAAGDAYVVGSFYTSFDRDFAVVKLAGSDGSEVWRQTIPGLEIHALDQAHAVALDPTGDVIAVGYLDNGGIDRLVIKFRASDGLELWRSNPSPIGDDELLAVAVDGSGDVFAVGFDNGGGERLLVEKIRGTDGAVLFSQTSSGTAGNRGLAVVVDGSGAPVVAGIRSIADEDFSVLKLPAGGGAPQWEVNIDGLVNGEDAARSLALAGSDVVAAGYLFRGPGGKDIVVAVDGDGGGHQIVRYRWRGAMASSCSRERMA